MSNISGIQAFSFWKAYLSIKQPLTAPDPIHPQVSSRHDPGIQAECDQLEASGGMAAAQGPPWQRCAAGRRRAWLGLGTRGGGPQVGLEAAGGGPLSGPEVDA